MFKFLSVSYDDDALLDFEHNIGEDRKVVDDSRRWPVSLLVAIQRCVAKSRFRRTRLDFQLIYALSCLTFYKFLVPCPVLSCARLRST